MTKFEKELLKELREIKEELRRSKEPQFTFYPPTILPDPNHVPFVQPYIGYLPPWGTTTCHLKDGFQTFSNM